MEFKDNLKELRKKEGLSQVDLAEKLGFSKSLVGLYETGGRKPSFEALETVADYFNVSIDYLMGKDDKSIYYLDPNTAQIAQEVFERPQMKILFDASRKVSPEDLDLIIKMLDRMKEEETHEDEE
ncbi:MAG: helix-turn-helix transcriptional regulator [Clostridia bacterium]